MLGRLAPAEFQCYNLMRYCIIREHQVMSQVAESHEVLTLDEAAPISAHSRSQLRRSWPLEARSRVAEYTTNGDSCEVRSKTGCERPDYRRTLLSQAGAFRDDESLRRTCVMPFTPSVVDRKSTTPRRADVPSR